MKKRATIIALILAFALALAPAACADILFTKTGNNPGDPVEIGLIEGEGTVTKTLVSNLGGSSGHTITSFTDASGDFRVAVSLYTYGTNTPDTINIYSPGPKENWSTPETWTPIQEFKDHSLQNVRGFAGMGDFLYGVAYDKPAVSKILASGSEYTEVAVYDDFTPPAGADAIRTEGIAAYNGNVYVVASCSSGDIGSAVKGKYLNNVIYKFDRDLNLVASADLEGVNFDGWTRGASMRVGNRLITANIGGVQPGNANPAALVEKSSVEVINLDTLKSEKLITAREVNEADATFRHMFSAVTAAPDGTVFIQAKQFVSDEYGFLPLIGIRIYKTTPEKLAEGDLGDVMYDSDLDMYPMGYLAGMEYDGDSGLLWIAEGWNFKSWDGSEWSDFGAMTIGGNHAGFAVIKPEGNMEPMPPLPEPAKSGSSGGCNAGFGALLLLALTPLCLKTGKRK
jgi:Synergist-CTERM protein sorting domain-containing protein